MKKIYAILERLICILAIVLLSLIATILFVKSNNELILVIIAYVCIVFIVVALLKLFFISSHIIIKDNIVKIFDFPFCATNQFYEKKRGLISWNSEINLKEVEKIELVKLTKNDKKKYIGYHHLFSKYIKVYIKNSNANKYIYISIYTNKQIMDLLKYFHK